MRCDPSDDISPPVIRKSKRRIVFKKQPTGQITAQAWPKPRGNRGTPNQASWVEDFVQAARDIKLTDPCTHQTAENYSKAPCSGYTFYRDYLMTARAGKMVYDDGTLLQNAIKPRVYRGGEKGIPRVTTPTANVSRTTAQALTQNADTRLNFDNVIWDNNAFFNPSANNKLTIRASGLYTFTAWLLFNGVSGGQRRTNIINVQQAAVVAADVLTPNTATAMQTTIHGTYYWNAGEDIAINVFSSSAGTTCQVRGFSIVAITPEAIL